MIIVEGPDGGGKTTLIKFLSELWELPVAPRVVSKDARAMTDLKQWVEINVSKGWQNMIFDRHRLISEPIYGPILRSSQASGFDNVDWLSVMMHKFYKAEPLIIYCMPPLEVVKQNIQNDPDNEVVQDHIEAIYSAYAARAALDWHYSPLSMMVWDYTVHGKEAEPMRIFNRWERIIERRRNW